MPEMPTRNNEHAQAMPPVSRTICSLVAARDGLLALALAAQARWRETNGYIFIPCELPAGEVEGEASAADAERVVTEAARLTLGCAASILPSDAVFGPSARHAIDRLALAADEGMAPPLPLLQMERGAPFDEVEGDGAAPDVRGIPPFRRVLVRAYHVAMLSEPSPGEGTPGLLWLAQRALRLALLGMPFTELATRDGVVWQPSPAVALPENAFVYVPADRGERHLLRIAAKYQRWG